MKVYTSKIVIEWAHCDAAGIAFYPNFYRWFDQNTERLFKANGLSYPELMAAWGVAGMPLLETGSKYKNACKLGDELELKTWIDEWAEKTFLVKHVLTHTHGRPALEGFERRVFAIDDPHSPKGMRAFVIPEEFTERFAD